MMQQSQTKGLTLFVLYLPRLGRRRSGFIQAHQGWVVSAGCSGRGSDEERSTRVGTWAVHFVK